MRISIGGPNSEFEAEAKRKYINEKELKKLLDGNPSSTELMRAKTRLNELIAFYDRIIRSINTTIKSINKNPQISYKEKKDKYLKTQEKELAQAQRERTKFIKYLKIINKKLAINS